jgi:hypothetical protein
LGGLLVRLEDKKTAQDPGYSGTVGSMFVGGIGVGIRSGGIRASRCRMTSLNPDYWKIDAAGIVHCRFYIN